MVNAPAAPRPFRISRRGTIESDFMFPPSELIPSFVRRGGRDSGRGGRSQAKLRCERPPRLRRCRSHPLLTRRGLRQLSDSFTSSIAHQFIHVYLAPVRSPAYRPPDLTGVTTAGPGLPNLSAAVTTFGCTSLSSTIV